MNFFRACASFFDNLNEWTGKAVSWLTLVLTFVTAWDVTARYLFKSGSVAIQELEWHIFAITFLLSAGYTLKHHAHVRVDIIYARLGKRGQAAIDLFGSLLFLLPFCVLMIYTSTGFIESSWAVRESSGDPGGLPARYILKSMIPVGFLLLGLQGVSLAINSAITIISKPCMEEDKG
ncbi:TRAP dicarboxylate transporter, DctQ subunit, unknown substrate 6 [hydrothermal vent metagenome]|uniref:Tripartite ATP-independent periplasmic transporters DctQ component domain-containing protein n=1 Tax=hydrothermal vent metagenome TaxID=652676 RepID=A0A3B1BN65_9ZZZZ